MPEAPGRTNEPNTHEGEEKADPVLDMLESMSRDELKSTLSVLEKQLQKAQKDNDEAGAKATQALIDVINSRLNLEGDLRVKQGNPVFTKPEAPTGIGSKQPLVAKAIGGVEEEKENEKAKSWRVNYHQMNDQDLRAELERLLPLQRSLAAKYATGRAMTSADIAARTDLDNKVTFIQAEFVIRKDEAERMEMLAKRRERLVPTEENALLRFKDVLTSLQSEAFWADQKAKGKPDMPASHPGEYRMEATTRLMDLRTVLEGMPSKLKNRPAIATLQRFVSNVRADKDGYIQFLSPDKAKQLLKEAEKVKKMLGIK